jgi:hypothetical protein
VRPSGAKTFSDLCDYWLDVRAPEKRSRETDDSFIRCHLEPASGSMLLREIGPRT